MGVVPILLCVFVAVAFEIPLHCSQEALEDTPLYALEASSTSISLNNFAKVQYYGSLYIGTPPQEFTFFFSTGSSWTWLNHASCGENCHKAKRFDPALSSSYVGTNKTCPDDADMQRGNGTIGFDNVSLSTNETPVRHPFLLFKTPYRLKNLKSDGVVGLAFAQRQEGAKTLVESLRDQRIIEDKLFALNLVNQSSSSLSFGLLNLRQYFWDPDFKWINLQDESGYWYVTLNGFSLNSDLPANSKKARAEIDSFISTIVLPKATFQLYRSTVCPLVSCDPDKDFIQFNCKNGEEKLWPNLTFWLDGKEFPISPQHYIVISGNICRDMVRTYNQNIYILGIPFLRTYYTVFDMDNYRIGLTRSISSSSTSFGSIIELTVLIFLTSLLLVIVVELCCYCFIRKSNIDTGESLPPNNTIDPLLPQNEDY